MRRRLDTDHMTENEFNALITRWNALRPPQRENLRRECINLGHVWRRVTYDQGLSVSYVVCARCVKYDNSRTGG